MSSSRAGPVRSRTGVKSMIDGDELVAAAGVPPHVLVDADHLHAVEAGRVVDQHPPALSQDSAVGGGPRHREGLGETSDGEMLTHQPDQRPPQRACGSASPAAPRRGWCPAATHARSRCSGTGGS